MHMCVCMHMCACRELKVLVLNLSLRSMIRSFAQEFDAREFARD